MPELRVGSLYSPSIPRWPEGIQVLGLSAERLEVALALDAPTEADVEAFRHAPLQVALTGHQELLILLLRIQGVLDWSDAPFDLRLQPEGERTPPLVGAQVVTWLLIDARSGVIRVVRVASLSAAFMRAVRERLERQLRLPFERRRYDQLVDGYQRAFSSRALLARAEVSEVAGQVSQSEAATAEVAGELMEELARLVADERVREVIAEAMARGEAHLERRGAELWYVDPGFGEDTPLSQLGYDERLGLVDRRQFPKAEG